MGMIQEFKPFAMRGNVVDIAVGIIIGGTFGKIVSSFVQMPSRRPSACWSVALTSLIQQ